MRKARPQHRILATCLVSLIAAVALVTSLTPNRAGALPKAPTYPREQTLVTSGTQWGTIQGFNPYFNNYAVGTVGLCNETLLRYDPLKDRYINWLAKSARFTAKNVYTVKVRPEIQWSNGKAFTGKDVAFNFRLGRFSNAFWHDLYSSLKAIQVNGLTVTFKFKDTPNYVQWQNLVWNLPMVNPGQAGVITSAASLKAYGQEVPIGTGPYELDVEGYDPTIRVVWKKKTVWWAAEQKVAPSPQPKYVIDLSQGGCNLACLLCCSLSGDLANSYIVGINEIVAGGDLQTYYPRKPYHLSANTVWLEVNTTHRPLHDPAFRRALATSIDVGNIVANDYHDLVLPANATGLLPIWQKWVDQKQLKALGFKYSPGKAKRLLRAAGYRDRNHDGYAENKNGKPIDLEIVVPSGWSDWESAESMIVTSAKKAGIKVTIDAGDYNHWLSTRNSGKFDLALDNSYQLSDNLWTYQLSDSPWTYYNAIFHLPVKKSGKGQTFANFGRYENVAAWNLVKQLDKTPPGNISKRRAIVTQLQKITLSELPVIPLWYQGVWAQWKSKYWTNWPSSTSTRNYIPCMWRGYMQMTGIDFITHLEQAPAASN